MRIWILSVVLWTIVGLAHSSTALLIEDELTNDAPTTSTEFAREGVPTAEDKVIDGLTIALETSTTKSLAFSINELIRLSTETCFLALVSDIMKTHCEYETRIGASID